MLQEYTETALLYGTWLHQTNPTYVLAIVHPAHFAYHILAHADLIAITFAKRDYHRLCGGGRGMDTA